MNRPFLLRPPAGVYCVFTKCQAFEHTVVHLILPATVGGVYHPPPSSGEETEAH